MSKIFVVSDWHLGENRFELMGRPFSDRQEMIQHFIKEHNKLVSKDDTVIVNGDVCYQKADDLLSTLDYVQDFNGKKILIRGNHDRVFTDEQLKPYFDTIIPEGDGMEYMAGNIPCWITHYPSRSRPDKFNLIGHIHAAFKYQLNMFNVGVDVNMYRPVDMDKIQFHYDAITKYYDDDVWAAYHMANMTHLGMRGKSGSYFTPAK